MAIESIAYGVIIYFSALYLVSIIVAVAGSLFR